MSTATTFDLLTNLGKLRTELVDLAYDLDVRGACAAADVAMTTSARLAELCEEFAAQSGQVKTRKNSSRRPKPVPSFVDST